MKYRFMELFQVEFPVGSMCQALEVSRSGYYAWLGRRGQPSRLSDQELIGDIQRIHRLSRQAYGSLRISAELRAQGKRCNHKRVARLMRSAGIQGCRKRPTKTTTHSQHGYPVATNLTDQQIKSAAHHTQN
ncbi:transposase, partial [bacterium]|nr:transposase [bacterium]